MCESSYILVIFNGLHSRLQLEICIEDGIPGCRARGYSDSTRISSGVHDHGIPALLIIELAWSRDFHEEIHLARTFQEDHPDVPILFFSERHNRPYLLRDLEHTLMRESSEDWLDFLERVVVLARRLLNLPASE